jgi:hypothetical protein
MIKDYLMHQKLTVRFAALWGLVGVGFLMAWTLSYLFLPEGFLRNQTIAQKVMGEGLAGGSVWLEWARIFAYNLGAACMLVILPNFLHTEKGYPLGYSTAGILAISFGVILGTNSFSISAGGKMAPTLAIFGSTGLYEISAYLLAAAATYSIARYQIVGKWPKQTLEPRVIPASPDELRERALGLVMAALILLIACGMEAYRIANAIAF